LISRVRKQPLFKFFSLPSDLIIHILSSKYYGITLKDISSLDIAIYNKEIKKLFLGCLKDENMTFAGINRISCPNENETKAKNYSYMNWIALRGISVKQLDFAHLFIGRTLFQTLVKRCKHLQQINLYGCTNGTNTFDYEIVKLSECCREITYINIGFLKVTDTAMIQLTKRCSSLRQLRAFQSTISNDTMFSLADNCSNLDTLDIGNNRDVTEDALYYLVLLNSNILHLNIANIMAISDFIIEVLAKHCTKLLTLNVSNCLIQDNSVSSLALNCSQLRSLNVSNCRRLTDASLSSLAINCPLLLEIIATNCHFSELSVRQRHWRVYL